MNVDRIWRAIQRQWQAVTNEFWPESSSERTQAEIGTLDREMERIQARMLRLRLRIEQSSGNRRARLEAKYEKSRNELDRRKRLRRELASGRVIVVG